MLSNKPKYTCSNTRKTETIAVYNNSHSHKKRNLFSTIFTHTGEVLFECTTCKKSYIFSLQNHDEPLKGSALPYIEEAYIENIIIYMSW